MEDVEKNPTKVTTPDYGLGESSPVVEEQHSTAWTRFRDSFKRMELNDIDTTGMTDLEIAAHMTAKAPLKRSLKGRHLQMIAIGGSIGTGLFVGSGSSLRTGGPAAVLIGFALIGIMLFFTVHALGELAVRFPVSGAFATYSTRFLDPAWGFAMGWNYALQWLVVFPLELVAASLTINYWRTDGSAAATVNPDAWVAIFYVLVFCINIFGVRGYGEAEFVFSITKVIAVVGFIILGIVLVCGGGPQGGYIGGKHWHDPGAFAHGFKGVISVLVNAAFAFSGTELVGLAAAESANPRKTLPTATKQVFWRILLFYIIALLLVGLLVPYDDPRLISSSSVDASASPFVIAITNAGISGLPSVMNVVILISVLSVGNSAVFGCSRTLAALAAQGQAPRFIGYIDRQGRPLVGILITMIFGLLSFMAGSDKQGDVFNWLLAFSGLSSLFTWGSICAAHIAFRAGMKKQGISLEELVFKAAGGVYGSWIGFLMVVVILALQFWIALFPLGGSPDPESFFMAYLSFPVVLVFYIGAKIWMRSPFMTPSKMDVTTGTRELDREVVIAEIQEEKERIRSKGIFYRVYKFWC